MIGTLRVLGRSLMWAAVSNPSIPGISTSSRMTAYSSLSKALSASSPERAGTRIWLSEPSVASSAVMLSARSSTSRILALSGIVVAPFSVGHAHQPAAHQLQQLVCLDRLGYVVGGSGLDALL